MKIVHVVPGNMDVGGIEKLLMTFYREVDRKKYQFDFIVHKKSKNYYEDEIFALGGRIHRLPNKSKNFFDYKRQFKKTIEEYDIIHIHSVYAFSYFEVKWATDMNKKVILHSHNSGASIKRKLVHKLLKPFQDAKLKNRLSCSVQASLWMFNKRNNKKVELLYNAFDVNKYIFNLESRLKFRKKFNYSEKNIVLGNTSRLSRQKNPIFLLEIFSELYESNKNFRLLLIGDGDLKQEVNEYIQNNNLENVVKVISNVNNINEYLDVMDVFVFPSLYEGLGISLVEAQINGLTCIVNENIPEEAVILDSVLKLSICDKEKWVNSILSMKSIKRKEATLGKFEHYEVRKEIKKLERYYDLVDMQNSNV